MISAIQTVPNIAAFSALPNLGRISYLPQGADSSLPNPSAILTLGTGLPVPLTYNAAGQFDTLLHETGIADNSAASGLDTATTAKDVSGTAAASSNLASNFLADDAAQTMTKIAADPSYANMAAALYMSAAMFRSQHAADVALPNTSRSIQPVRELRAVYPV